MISPFVSVLNTIILPFLIAGFLYYITNPIVEFLEKKFHLNRIWGILLTLVTLFGSVSYTISEPTRHTRQSRLPSSS